MVVFGAGGHAHVLPHKTARSLPTEAQTSQEKAHVLSQPYQPTAHMLYLAAYPAGEALWQPPSTGYTKHDGKLVLASGEVLADPLQGKPGCFHCILPPCMSHATLTTMHGGGGEHRRWLRHL